ncbi:MAG: terminase family protein [Candidatus Bathyarchaeia archaeon]
MAESLRDPVTFARNFLNFEAFPYQEEFLRDESPLIAACCGRQVGKTTLAAIKALHFALSRNMVRILIVSAGLRQSIILFDKILHKTETSIPAKALMTYKSRTTLRFTNGSEIVALPCGREGSTLRGQTADMVILDEANFIPRIVIDSVIRPTMITRPNSRLIMISTPWVRDHPFYEALSKPELGFKAYTWPSSISPLITPAKLERERKTIGEYDFNREYNAVFIDDEFSYLPSNLVLSCTDDYELDGEPRPGNRLRGEYIIGIDFGKHADHSAIAVLEKVGDGVRLVYLNELPLETSYTSVIGTVRRLNEAYSFAAGCLDKTGVGEGPYEEIKQFMRGMEGVTLTAQVKEDLMGKLKLALEQGRLTLPRDNPQLLVQMTAQQCEPTKSGTLKFSHPTGTHDDQLWSLALATYASQQQTRPNFKPITRSF